MVNKVRSVEKSRLLLTDEIVEFSQIIINVEFISLFKPLNLMI